MIRPRTRVLPKGIMTGVRSVGSSGGYTVVRADSYALAAPESGNAVLIDLKSGDSFELNRTAHLVWAQHLAGKKRAAIAADLARDFALATSLAEEHVNQALGTVKTGRPSPPASEYEMIGK